MLQMFFKIWRGDEHVIEINFHERHVPEEGVHVPLESLGGVSEPQRHADKLE